jgi:hypothetical protein
MRSNVIGYCYLLHFTRPYIPARIVGKKLQYAQHYLGWSEHLIPRLTEHKNGNGARLVHIIQQAGIDWQLARVWGQVDRYFERSLKNQGHAPRMCPLCRGTGVALEWESMTLQQLVLVAG